MLYVCFLRSDRWIDHKRLGSAGDQAFSFEGKDAFAIHSRGAARAARAVATDSDTSAERDHIVTQLRTKRVIGDVVLHQSGSRLQTGKVNHYITDGEIAFANLMDS